MTTDVIAPATAIRVGFVGSGFMASVHSRAARAARAELGGAASSSEASAADAALRLGLDRSYVSVAELLADDGIDIVHICTPNTTHAAFALAALDAGKHVICEKPLATTVTDAATLTERAAERGLTATVPVRLPLPPDGARGPRPGRRRRGRPPAHDPGRLPAGLARSSRRPTTGASTSASAARRGPSPTSDRTSSTCSSSSPATASPGSRPRRAPCTPTAEPTPTSPRKTSSPWSSNCSGGAVGTLLISQVAPGRKNSLVLEIAGTAESIRFDQERPGGALARSPHGFAAHPARHRRPRAVGGAAVARAGRAPDGLPGRLQRLRRRQLRGHRRSRARRTARASPTACGPCG